MPGEQSKKKSTIRIAVIGSVLVAVILIVGTIWMGQSAKKDTETAVHSVSLLFMDELAARRKQVVASNLERKIDDIRTAVDLMTENDLSDSEHLQAYQARMKRIYNLEKFAFVDTDGLIYTSKGTQTNIDEYQIDYRNITEPDISIFNLESTDKKVIVAIPIEGVEFEGKQLKVCFMEIDMEEMLEGVSMEPDKNQATFCNMYTKDGVPLTDSVLGGLAVEDNLLEAMQRADYDPGYSYENLVSDFSECNRGVVSFSYNGIRETLCYVPIEGTDWLLTYLIRESVISENIGAVTDGIVTRSLVQSGLTAIVLILMFIFILGQSRKNAKLTLEKEATEVENRVKQEEMEQKLILQKKLLKEEKQRTQQTKMITALSSDYRSVYYLDLDADEGVCYQSHKDLDNGLNVGETFRYLEAVTQYAQQYVTDTYREEFLKFTQPESIREGLKTKNIISFRYTVFRHGKESYEMARFAGVRRPEDRDDNTVHAVGACFTNVDEETRQAIAQNEALENALAAAEQASKAKTSFLSNMSHEIRTPMNAIIGLDHIALNDPEVTPKTRDYLTKIGYSAEHLLQLINDILDMSRIESGRMLLKNEDFSFSKLLEYINTVFSGQCSENGIDYRCHIIGHVDDHYIGDNMKLRQVLINILGNAVKFTPTGGCVSLTVERTAQYGGNSTLCFKIKDTGIGISKEFLPHIFDTFAQEDSSSTNKYGSSGLGLAITKSIAEMMNGRIQVDSEKGKGTVFTVTVTLRDAEDHTELKNRKELDPQDMTVLIVDDDPVAREHAGLVLEKAGIGSESAESGEEAIEKVKLRHARRAPYNLILIDWKMPGMDGVETARQIRSATGDESAIIILTAYNWDDVLDEAIEAGVDSFVSKPLFAANVLDEFHDAVKRKGIVKDKDEEKVSLIGKRILLAEDVDINAEIIMMTLQMEGVESERAFNGLIALEMFFSHPEGYYDAILMDMRMPEMDGLEATRMIRKSDRRDAGKIPIIALTANAFDEDVQRSLQAGLNAHLSKPVKPEELFDILRGIIKD